MTQADFHPSPSMPLLPSFFCFAAPPIDVLTFVLFLPPLPNFALPFACRASCHATTHAAAPPVDCYLCSVFCRHFHFALPAACSDDATTPPLTLPHLRLFVTFFLFFAANFHYALSAACRNDFAQELPPCHHSRCHSSG